MVLLIIPQACPGEKRFPADSTREKEKSGPQAACTISLFRWPDQERTLHQTQCLSGRRPPADLLQQRRIHQAAAAGQGHSMIQLVPCKTSQLQLADLPCHIHTSTAFPF